MRQKTKSVKHLPSEHKDLSSIPTAHGKKKMGVVVCTCNPSARELEKGRSRGLLASQISLIGKFQASEKKSILAKKKSKEYLRANTKGHLMAFPGTCTHMNTHNIHAYTHAHKHTSLKRFLPLETYISLISVNTHISSVCTGVTPSRVRTSFCFKHVRSYTSLPALCFLKALRRCSFLFNLFSSAVLRLGHKRSLLVTRSPAQQALHGF